MFVSFLALSSLICLSSGTDPMKGGITDPEPATCPVPYNSYASHQSCNAYFVCWGNSQSGIYSSKFACPKCDPSNVEDTCCNGLLCYYPPDWIQPGGRCDYCGTRDCAATCPEGPDASTSSRNMTLPAQVSEIVNNINNPKRT